ncbi:MAG: hypothetical protein KKA32_15850 [Actinobacteria bacterium]|nr:hypothetical protein [Actinomycetota bacterium]
MDIGPATKAEAALAERRAFETLEGFLALRWRTGWAEGRTGCFVVRAGGEMVSSVFVVRTPLHWPQAHTEFDVGPGERALPVVEVACLDSLITPARHRRNGYAGALLEWVHGWAVETGLAGTALFSEIGTSYYRERGFHVLPMPFYRGPLSDGIGRSAVEGRPFRVDDLERVAAVYTAAARRVPLSVARDVDYWLYHLDHSRFVGDLHSDDPDPWDFVVDADDTRAYVRSRSDGDIFTVLEAACLPGAEGLLMALLESGLRRARESGCLRVVLHLHPAVAEPPGLVLRETWYETFLVRPTVAEEGVFALLASGEAAESPATHDSGSACRGYIFRPDYF